MIRCSLFVSALVIAIAGCGESGPKKYWVEGTVTFDGAAIEKGDIVLKSLDPTVTDDADKIVNGKYRFQALPGKKSVRIHANRESAEVDPVMGAKKMESYIPREYSSDESTLEMNVTPAGPNKFDFALTSPK